MRQITALALCAALAACVDWPVVDAPPASRASADWPDLIPISSLPAPVADDLTTRANAALLARAAALRARAAILRRPVPDQAAFERLRARMAR